MIFCSYSSFIIYSRIEHVLLLIFAIVVVISVAII